VAQSFARGEAPSQIASESLYPLMVDKRSQLETCRFIAEVALFAAGLGVLACSSDPAQPSNEVPGGNSGGHSNSGGASVAGDSAGGASSSGSSSGGIANGGNNHGGASAGGNPTTFGGSGGNSSLAGAGSHAGASSNNGGTAGAGLGGAAGSSASGGSGGGAPPSASCSELCSGAEGVLVVCKTYLRADLDTLPKCLANCAGLAEGTPGTYYGNSRQCRLSHLAEVRNTPDSAEKATHCGHVFGDEPCSGKVQ